MKFKIESSIRTSLTLLTHVRGFSLHQDQTQPGVPLSHWASLTPNAPAHSSPACSTMSPSALLKQSVEP